MYSFHRGFTGRCIGTGTTSIIRKHAVTFGCINYNSCNRNSTSIPQASTVSQYRSMATGSRGSRGYGWFYHYRQGNGGRHLQGEYYDRDSIETCMAWNESVIQLGSQRVYMDIVAEPRRNVNSKSSSSSSSSASTTSKATTINNNPKKYFEVPPMDTLTGEKHRIVIDIASTVLPATCQNFINLLQMKASAATETAGTGITPNDTVDADDNRKGYRGTRLYRIEKDVGIYGGDVLTNTGRTGRAYNATALTTDVSQTDPIPLWHIPGTVTMIVSTVNEIDSRFLLCTQHAPHIDGISRPFGMMTPQSLHILQNWQQSLLTVQGGVPNAFDLYITDCGVLIDDQNEANTLKKISPLLPPEATSKLQQQSVQV
jgi:cyclophilin family peptidyl-prolyl cis-trans isomerase